jgi:hypothetical protein
MPLRAVFGHPPPSATVVIRRLSFPPWERGAMIRAMTGRVVCAAITLVLALAPPARAD